MAVSHFNIKAKAALVLPEGGFALADLQGDAVVALASVDPLLGRAVYTASGTGAFDEILVEYDYFEDYEGAGPAIFITAIVYRKEGKKVWDAWTEIRSELDGQSETEFFEARSFFDEELAAGNNLFFGSKFDDVLHGGGETDDMWGEKGSDKLYGGAATDVLSGGGGRDVLYGGAGRDGLTGGYADHNGVDNARDVLYGGGGRDDFIFLEKCGTDIIKDFEIKKDRLLFDTPLAFSEDQIEAAAREYKGGVALRFSKDEVIKIEGIALGDVEKLKLYFGADVV